MGKRERARNIDWGRGKRERENDCLCVLWQVTCLKPVLASRSRAGEEMFQ